MDDSSSASIPVAGSLEIGLHLFLPPGELAGALRHLRTLARAAVAAGFDLVSTGEHHGDTRGYLPTSWPLLASLLSELPSVRAGAYPVLAGLREPAMLVEECEVALAAFPGRMHVAVGVGYTEHDFQYCGVERTGARRRFKKVLASMNERVVRGRIPAGAVLVAGGGTRSRSAALAHGAGLLLPPLSSPDEALAIAEYRDGGGGGRVVVQRWLAVDADDSAAYRELKTPWDPERLAPTSVGELTDVFGGALEAAGTGGVSVRIGGPRTDPHDVQAAFDLCGEAIAALASTIGAR